MSATIQVPCPAYRDDECEELCEAPIFLEISYEPKDGDGWNEPRTGGYWFVETPAPSRCPAGCNLTVDQRTDIEEQAEQVAKDYEPEYAGPDADDRDDE
jgi:hypothetical protein